MLLVQRHTSRTSIFCLASFRVKGTTERLCTRKNRTFTGEKNYNCITPEICSDLRFFPVYWQVSLDVAGAMAHSQDFNFFMAGFRENRIKMGKYECTVTC
jgi:hypothetical protein